ncbi:MAG: non-homologous end-joining DNA ligase [Phycisphaerae bacterium]
MSKKRVKILNRNVHLSNLDKVLYPEAGFTKAGVLEYYRAVSPWILPHLRARPLTLKRYPDGVEGEPFYEKRCPQHRPDWMTTAEVVHSGSKRLRYCTITDLPGLMWAANLGSLELHVLMSRAPQPGRPTGVVFDLDPGAPAGLMEAGRIALLLRRVLDRIGLQSTVKVSGGKGVHCWVPLNTPVDFEQTKDFARTVAGQIEKHNPDTVTSKMAKAGRTGKVFIDWSQNDAHKTTVSVYSLRAQPRPTVSAPVSWDELESAVEAGRDDALQFAPDTVVDRLEQRGDLFAPALTLRQTLPGVKPPDLPAARQWSGTKGEVSSLEAKAPAVSLSEYRAKRNFVITPEPAGGAAAEALRGIFVIQKHDARRLHYDLRIEAGGVLKSWAVPKGPSLDPAEKRLAVEVEDHPLEYARFEGRIPKGEYGGGQVIIWDFGRCEVAGDENNRDRTIAQAIKKGSLDFFLDGVKLHGAFKLVRSGKDDSGKNQWLLMKRKDASAHSGMGPTEAEPYSVLSGLWVEDLAER